MGHIRSYKGHIRVINEWLCVSFWSSVSKGLIKRFVFKSFLKFRSVCWRLSRMFWILIFYYSRNEYEENMQYDRVNMSSLCQCDSEALSSELQETMWNKLLYIYIFNLLWKFWCEISKACLPVMGRSWWYKDVVMTIIRIPMVWCINHTRSRINLILDYICITIKNHLCILFTPRTSIFKSDRTIFWVNTNEIQFLLCQLCTWLWYSN